MEPFFAPERVRVAQCGVHHASLAVGVAPAERVIVVLTVTAGDIDGVVV